MKAHFYRNQSVTPEGREILRRALQYVDLQAQRALYQRDLLNYDAYTMAGNHLHYLIATGGIDGQQ